MSFREKIHWITFVAIILAYGWYFLSYPWPVIATPAGLRITAGMLLPTTIGIVVIMTIAAAIVAIRKPTEVDLKKDERDRTINISGAHSAYYLLVLGVWANILAIPYGISSAGQLNLLLATAVLAELVRIGSQLYLYRQGN